ncbi:hypothetical protein C8J56DRAFT_885471 [Mycena floridula]|nr:hypothetical protein C8J56DRAFT_885471 [Mycena floridula]
MYRNDSGVTDESPFGSPLATPVDEEDYSFDRLGENLFAQSVVDHFSTPKSLFPRVIEPKESVTPKPRPLFKAVTKAKKLAKSLPGAPTELAQIPLPDSPSTDGSSDSPMLDHHNASSMFYNHPNLSIEALEHELDRETLPQNTPFFPRSDSMIGIYSDIPGKPSYMIAPPLLNAETNALDASPRLENADFENSVTLPIDPPANTIIPTLSLRNLTVAATKVALFLPWTALVGATIILCPQWLERVTFSPGYISSPRGIRRFAHWTEYAVAHIMIFLAAIAVVIWWNLPVGIALAGGIVGQFILTWRDFVPDKNVLLGEDDRQSIFLAVTCSFNEEFMLKKTDHGYLVTTPTAKALEDDADEEEI